MKHATRVLPGFGLTLGYTVFYLSLVVLIPVGALLLKAVSFPFDALFAAAFSPRAIASYQVTFIAALGAAFANAIFGTLVAWCLVRYSFPGRSVIDALVDLPFALPTAVSGIASPPSIRSPAGLANSCPLGIEVAFTPLGITVALLFIGLPFVVRSVQPAFEELDPPWRMPLPSSAHRAGRPCCACSSHR